MLAYIAEINYSTVIEKGRPGRNCSGFFEKTGSLCTSTHAGKALPWKLSRKKAQKEEELIPFFPLCLFTAKYF